jgi:hypothetical protein
VTIGLIRPSEDEVLHFSGEQSIALFVPHVAPTAQQVQAHVWAVDFDQALSYWFRRQCPRVLTWASARTTADDRDHFLGSSWRVHAIEYAWLDRLQSTVLYTELAAAICVITMGRPRKPG